MKIKNSTSGRKKIILLISVLVIASLGTITYALTRDQNKIATEQNDKTSSIKEDQVEENRDATDTDASDKSDLPSKNSSVSPDDNQLSDTNNSSVATPTNAPEKPVISRASQKDSSIKVVATFNAASPGYCELKLSGPAQQRVTREAKIVVGPSYYSCDFIVAVNDLPAKGTWSVAVVHHVGYAATISDTSTVEIQ